MGFAVQKPQYLELRVLRVCVLVNTKTRVNMPCKSDLLLFLVR